MSKVRRILLAVAIAVAACSEQPKREVTALVVDIRSHISPKWNTDELVVEARTVEGLRATKSIMRRRLNCRVGDAIKATVSGVSMTLDDRACQS